MENVIEYDSFYKIKRKVGEEDKENKKHDNHLELEEFIIFGCKCTG